MITQKSKFLLKPKTNNLSYQTRPCCLGKLGELSKGICVLPSVSFVPASSSKHICNTHLPQHPPWVQVSLRMPGFPVSIVLRRNRFHIPTLVSPCTPPRTPALQSSPNSLVAKLLLFFSYFSFLFVFFFFFPSGLWP